MIHDTQDSLTLAIEDISRCLQSFQHQPQHLLLFTRCVYGLLDLLQSQPDPVQSAMARSNVEVLLRTLQHWLAHSSDLQDPALERALANLLHPQNINHHTQPPHAHTHHHTPPHLTETQPPHTTPQAQHSSSSSYIDLFQSPHNPNPTHTQPTHAHTHHHPSDPFAPLSYTPETHTRPNTTQPPNNTDTIDESILQHEGGCVSSAHVSNLLNISRQAIHQRRQKGSLIAYKKGREYLYPSWQFTEHGDTIPGLEATLARLNSVPPLAQISFFLTPHPDLDYARPLDALRLHNKTDDIVRLASGYEIIYNMQ